MGILWGGDDNRGGVGDRDGDGDEDEDRAIDGVLEIIKENPIMVKASQDAKLRVETQ